MLKAFAPPAASVPPSTVQITRWSGGRPWAATTCVGTVVTSRSSMIRGLVRATKAPTRERVTAEDRVTVWCTRQPYDRALSRIEIKRGPNRNQPWPESKSGPPWPTIVRCGGRPQRAGLPEGDRGRPRAARDDRRDGRGRAAHGLGPRLHGLAQLRGRPARRAARAPPDGRVRQPDDHRARLARRDGRGPRLARAGATPPRPDLVVDRARRRRPRPDRPRRARRAVRPQPGAGAGPLRRVDGPGRRRRRAPPPGRRAGCAAPPRRHPPPPAAGRGAGGARGDRHPDRDRGHRLRAPRRRRGGEAACRSPCTPRRRCTGSR